MIDLLSAHSCEYLIYIRSIRRCVQVHVRYFGRAGTAAGLPGESIEMGEGSTVAELVAQVFNAHPPLQGLGLAIALNSRLLPAGSEVPLSPGDEVAFLPPVSGGVDDISVRLTSGRISLEEVISSVRREAGGAVVLFVGTARTPSRGREVLRLEYEAYTPMAERVLGEIAAEARNRWPVLAAAIVHRVGTVLPGEEIVAIAVSTPHRGEGYEASRYIIERLKERAPIWKKEVHPDGEEWVEGRPVHEGPGGEGD